MDSLEAAGWKFPGRPENGTQQPGERDAQNGGSSADPARDKPRTPGDPPTEGKTDAEKDPKADKTGAGAGAQPTEKPEGTADPAQTGNGGPEAEKPGQTKAEDPRQGEGERDNDGREAKTGQSEAGEAGSQDGNKEARPQDKGGSAADGTDDPEPPQQQTALPADNTVAPKPPSRLEHIARAREAQLVYAEELRAKGQDAEPSNGTGEGPLGESGDGGAPPQDGNAGKGTPEKDAQPPGTEIPLGETGADDASGGGGDQTPSPTSGEGAEPPAPEAGRPQDQEPDPLAPQDAAKSGTDNGGPPPEPVTDGSPPDPPADGSPPADDQTQDGTDGKDGALPGSEVGHPTDPAAETGTGVPEPGREASSTGPETTDQGTEPPEPMAADGTTGNETDDPKPPADTTPPPEGTGEHVPPPEALGEQGDGHGKTAKGTESIESTDETDPPDREAEKPAERGESGTELTPHEDESTDIEPSRFAGRVTITLDRDGRPIPPDRPDADTETPGRGELRRPEDDRASRDYQERKPDKLSRLRGELKKFVDRSDNTKDSVEKFSAPAQNKLERVKPTGQSCGARLNTDHIKAPDEKIKAGDTVLGAVGTVIVLTEIIRFGINIARNSRRREHADH
ncbi:hypothetical protein ACIBI3_25250 [Actinomadura luteofluorescens]|uniref:hypothetical protein n=1 Tax=Actinomadura luteofluorescens TaxID=46163 RepID=UPI00346D9C6A